VPESLLNLDALAAAITATAKVFLLGMAGFLAVRRGWLSSESLGAVSALVANLTLPCLIFSHFAAQFDPQTFPLWWLVALAGFAFQGVSLTVGWLASRRTSAEKGRDEMTMLVGFQNSGFFVLPMLQALLPPAQFERAAVVLFVFIIGFNALGVARWNARSASQTRLQLSSTRDIATNAGHTFRAGYLRRFPRRAPTAANHAHLGRASGRRNARRHQFARRIDGSARDVGSGRHNRADRAPESRRAFLACRVGNQRVETGVLPLLGWTLMHFWPTPLFETTAFCA
jgi:hypothetical protein